MALDRDQVIKAAIELLDKVGLDGLSLRRLATELNIQAPALYWHFKNKQELLDQMAATIADQESPFRPLLPGESWTEWMTNRARAMRGALNSHRDGAMLVSSTHPAERHFGEIEKEMEILMSGGLSAPAAMHAMIAVGNYVSGFTLEEQADRMRGKTQEHHTEADFEAWLARMSAWPRTVAALRGVGDPQSDNAFEAGLALIIDGIRAAAEKSKNGEL